MWDDQNDSYYNKDIREMVLIISGLWQNIKLPFTISEVATIVSEKKADSCRERASSSRTDTALQLPCIPFWKYAWYLGR